MLSGRRHLAQECPVKGRHRLQPTPLLPAVPSPGPWLTAAGHNPPTWRGHLLRTPMKMLHVLEVALAYTQPLFSLVSCSDQCTSMFPPVPTRPLLPVLQSELQDPEGISCGPRRQRRGGDIPSLMAPDTPTSMLSPCGLQAPHPEHSQPRIMFPQSVPGPGGWEEN